MGSQLGLIEQSLNNRYSLWVREALDELADNFTITDPSITGHPIVFASRGFLKMSGYSREEIIGRNGRMFQGPRTSRRTVMEIRGAICEERTIEVNLLNYKKDGTPFWMLFKMSPVFGKEDGKVTHFVAVQVPVVSIKHRRNSGMSYSEDGGRPGLREIVFGSCRREVCSDSLLDLDRVLSLDSDSRGLEIEDACEASDLEKRKAATAINNILSVLTHFSELTGRLVCGKRCIFPVAGFISSSLYISLGRIKQSFVLTDPHLPDMPIVYASDDFLRLTGSQALPKSQEPHNIMNIKYTDLFVGKTRCRTCSSHNKCSLSSYLFNKCIIGYDRKEVLGCNCRFLNGVDTDTSALNQIKESIRTEQACTVRILYYRKDKSSFWNLLHISPVRNASGKIAYFAAVQTEEGCKNQDRRHGMSPEMRQLSAIGAIKVAVRSLTMGAGSSKS